MKFIISFLHFRLKFGRAPESWKNRVSKKTLLAYTYDKTVVFYVLFELVKNQILDSSLCHSAINPGLVLILSGCKKGRGPTFFGVPGGMRAAAGGRGG